MAFWSASQVEAKLQGKPDSSMLVIEGARQRQILRVKTLISSQSGAQSESGR